MTYIFFKGFYPLIGWKIGQEVVCLAEGNAGDTGTAIKWAQQLGKSSLTRFQRPDLKNSRMPEGCRSVRNEWIV